METVDLWDEEPNYYWENIFNCEDFHLYRAVINFYAGHYKKAEKDFESSSKIMHANKSLNKTSANFELWTNNQTSDSNETDLSDVGLCSLNIHEHTFNIVLCLLKESS